MKWRGLGQEMGCALPLPLSFSQVRSERPLFSSNPELDNLVRPWALPNTLLQESLLFHPLVAVGLIVGAERDHLTHILK